MNKEEIIKALNNLIKDFNNYDADYTITGYDYYKKVFVEIKNQLEEKDKIIDEAIKQINKIIIKPTPFFKNLEGNILASKEEAQKLLEILERGRNEKK